MKLSIIKENTMFNLEVTEECSVFVNKELGDKDCQIQLRKISAHQKYLYIRYNCMKNICRIKNKMEEAVFLIEKWGKKFTKERKLTNNIYKNI